MKTTRLLTVALTSLSLLSLTGCSEEFKINDISFELPPDCKVDVETEYTSLGNYISFFTDGIYFSLQYECIDEGENEDTVFENYCETLEYGGSYEQSEIFYIDGVKIVKYNSVDLVNNSTDTSAKYSYNMSQNYCFCYNDVFYDFSIDETCDNGDEVNREFYNKESYKKVREVIDTLTFN